MKAIKRNGKLFIKTHKDSYDKKSVEKGCEAEQEEHPDFDEDIIEKLVKDHLKIDPEYYDKDDSDDTDEDDEKGKKGEKEDDKDEKDNS